MAKYTVQHSCGHSVEHQLYGKYSERESRKQWLAGQECSECYKTRQAEQAAATATEQGLPELTGSDKQTAWALTIRAEMLSKLAELRGLVEANAAQNQALAAQMLAAIDSATQQVAAAWWIDRRNHTAQQIARELFAAQQPA